MTLMQKIGIGLGSVVALAVFALPQWNSGHAAFVTAEVDMKNAQPLNTPETPQAMQWDMIYGDKTPPPNL
ncbi:MAG TPA: hypothetical protein VFE23_04485 [Usitatibacter sp.]|nr:hypothetical protein [Usitatibacter sp.]